MIAFRGSACLAFVAILSIGILSLGSIAQADPVAVELPPQPLASALREFARQTGIQVAIPAELTDGKMSVAVKGSFEPADVLNRLLKGSGLVAYPVNRNTYGIRSESSAGTTRSLSARLAADSASLDRSQSHLAQTNQPASFDMASSAQGQSGKNESPGLTEIIVTAQKRSERIQDVPVPVTALDAETLTNSNQLRLQDYYNQVPGLMVAPASVAGYQLLSIRGISTGYANPTVGITVDDVPYGASTVNGGNVPPDIDPGDLASIEVLRGPQGTLYGASSIGGLIKYVTADPSTDALSGRVQAGVSDVYNGAQPGYNVRGSINVPLGDALAVRASGFSREDPGYIDNPVLDIDGINRTVAYGGHLAVLWRPSELFSVKLSALFQDTKAHGAADVDITALALAPSVGYVLPKLGDLQQDYIPGTGGFETKVQAYSTTIRAKLGVVDLTSVTGFNANNYFTTTDFSYLYGSYTENVFGVAGSPISASTKGAHKFTQELRLSSTIASTVDWLVGGFYTHENSPFPSTIYAENPSTGANVGLFGTFNLQSTFEEYAAFSDLTFHFTDRFEIQVGGRESEIRQTYQDTDTAYAASVFDGTTYPAPYIGPEGRSKVSAFTYLFTPQFKLTPDVMTYIRLASGYRAGGPNVGVGVPTQYEPDKTYNYELGVKGDVLDHRLSFDASVYYIDWRNIQVELIDQQTGLFFTGNAAEAKSQGVELSAEVRPLRGLRIDSWVAFSDAELSKAFPVTAIDAGTYGASGNRLPYASRISGHASLDDEFPLMNSISGSVGGEVNYTGNRLGNFQGVDTTTDAPLPRQELPGYAQVNLRAGVKYQSWAGNFFVNNVLDKRGVLDGGIGTNIPYAFLYIQPRTVGLNVVKTF